MSVLNDAKQAMMDLADLTEGFAHGAPPDAYSVLGYQSKLVRYYSLIGEEMARKFGAKERAYLSRKIEQAKAHAHGRIDGLTSKDSEERAFREVQKQHEDEIDRAEEFELYRIFLKSLQNSIDHSRQVVSFLKGSESNPSSSHP